MHRSVTLRACHVLVGSFSEAGTAIKKIIDTDSGMNHHQNFPDEHQVFRCMEGLNVNRRTTLDSLPLACLSACLECLEIWIGESCCLCNQNAELRKEIKGMKIKH